MNEHEQIELIRGVYDFTSARATYLVMDGTDRYSVSSPGLITFRHLNLLTVPTAWDNAGNVTHTRKALMTARPDVIAADPTWERGWPSVALQD